MIDALSPDRLIGLLPVLLPLLLGCVGWLSVHIARWAALYPKNFFGVRSFLGWQGYLHARHDIYVAYWCRGLLEKLGSLDQVFEQLGPEKLISHQLSRLRPQMDSFIDEVMGSRNPILWENLPILVKNRFYARAHRMLPRIIDDIVEDLGDSIRRIITYPQLLEYAEQESPGTLQRFYDILTRRAFNRLAWYCAGVGFSAGIVQLAIAWKLNSQQLLFWSLSAATICLCFFWLSQQRVRTPVVPTTVGPFILRSLVNQMRAQQDRELADFLAATVLSPRNIARTLMLDGKARQARLIVKRRISPLLEEFDIRTLAQVTVGPIGYVNLKLALVEKLIESFLEPFDDTEFTGERGKILAEFFHHRIEKLPDQLFFQQMKWTLDPLAIIGTLAGVLLGTLAGGVQWMLLFF